MRGKKSKIIFNLFFMLLGLTLVCMMLIKGLDSSRNWFSLIVGSLVAVTSFVDVIRVNKSDNRSNAAKRK